LKKFLVVLLTSLALSGCEQREVFSEKQLTMTVESVKLTSKSNSKVTLRDDASGQVYSDNRLSCNRTRASRVVIGSKWVVTEVTYVYPESRRYTSELVGTRGICPQ
jgi:hypothetical protein